MKKSYNIFFLTITIVMVCLTVIMAVYVLNENDFLKDIIPKEWKLPDFSFLMPKKDKKESEKDEGVELVYNDPSFYGIYEHVSLVTSLRDIADYHAFSGAELLTIIQKDFVTGDFTETSSGKYTLSTETITKYLQRIFGSEFEVDISIFVDCSATLSGTTGNSLGGTIMTLGDYKSGAFTVEFSNPTDETFAGVTILDRKILKAVKYKDSIVVQDQIIYPALEVSDDKGTYTYKIYADYEHRYLIDTLTFTPDTIGSGVIDIDEYIGKASIIEYHFSLKDDKYYYQSSSFKIDDSNSYVE